MSDVRWRGGGVQQCMRSLRIVATLLAGSVTAGGVVVAQPSPSPSASASPSPDQPTATSPVSVVARLDPARDAFFAENAYTFTNLLHLGADGTFARYTRHHMMVTFDDQGRWRQSEDGTLRLCSHHHYTSLHANGLSIYRLEQSDTAKLPALAAGIQKRLDAHPAKTTFRDEELKPAVFGKFLASEDPINWPPDAIGPAVERDTGAASRADLVALVAALRARASSRDGTLTSQKVMRLQRITWLATPESEPKYFSDSEVETRLLDEYRRHRKGPFLPGTAPVAVSAASFKELLGTRQGFMFHTGMNQVIPRDADLEDSRGKRLAAPECGAFADLARPLPAGAASRKP
jgi:hypothetical protein